MYKQGQSLLVQEKDITDNNKFEISRKINLRLLK